MQDEDHADGFLFLGRGCIVSIIAQLFQSLRGEYSKG